MHVHLWTFYFIMKFEIKSFFPPSVAFLLWQRSAGDIMIRNIQPKHAGKYTCAVQTKVDSVSIATDVVVRGKRSLTIPVS